MGTGPISLRDEKKHAAMSSKQAKAKLPAILMVTGLTLLLFFIDCAFQEVSSGRGVGRDFMAEIVAVIVFVIVPAIALHFGNNRERLGRSHPRELEDTMPEASMLVFMMILLTINISLVGQLLVPAPVNRTLAILSKSQHLQLQQLVDLPLAAGLHPTHLQHQHCAKANLQTWLD